MVRDIANQQASSNLEEDTAEDERETNRNKDQVTKENRGDHEEQNKPMRTVNVTGFVNMRFYHQQADNSLSFVDSLPTSANMSVQGSPRGHTADSTIPPIGDVTTVGAAVVGVTEVSSMLPPLSSRSTRPDSAMPPKTASKGTRPTLPGGEDKVSSRKEGEVTNTKVINNDGRHRKEILKGIQPYIPTTRPKSAAMILQRVLHQYKQQPSAGHGQYNMRNAPPTESERIPSPSSPDAYRERDRDREVDLHQESTSTSNSTILHDQPSIVTEEALEYERLVHEHNRHGIPLKWDLTPGPPSTKIPVIDPLLPPAYYLSKNRQKPHATDGRVSGGIRKKHSEYPVEAEAEVDAEHRNGDDSSPILHKTPQSPLSRKYLKVSDIQPRPKSAINYRNPHEGDYKKQYQILKQEKEKERQLREQAIQERMMLEEIQFHHHRNHHQGHQHYGPHSHGGGGVGGSSGGIDRYLGPNGSVLSSSQDSRVFPYYQSPATGGGAGGGAPPNSHTQLDMQVPHDNPNMLIPIVRSRAVSQGDLSSVMTMKQVSTENTGTLERKNSSVIILPKTSNPSRDVNDDFLREEDGTITGVSLSPRSELDVVSLNSTLLLQSPERQFDNHR
jgi:hypothetical protein